MTTASRYATEVDVDFVRKAVRSLGRLAIKVQPAADDCIKALLELIETKVTYVVQEAVIVIKDVFRRYPGRYEGIIPTLCANLDSLDEPESKAAMIWIVGQFADRIENADELMDDLTYTFLEEPTEVQFALLSAAVKVFIYKSQSDTTKALVHKVLKWATEEVDNPDLRDRGFMYWRLLALSPSAASEIVLAEKPAITTDADRMDRGALDQLLLHTGTLGSIYHKNPEVRRSRLSSPHNPQTARRPSSAAPPAKRSATALRSTRSRGKSSSPSRAHTSSRPPRSACRAPSTRASRTRPRSRRLHGRTARRSRPRSSRPRHRRPPHLQSRRRIYSAARRTPRRGSTIRSMTRRILRARRRSCPLRAIPMRRWTACSGATLRTSRGRSRARLMTCCSELPQGQTSERIDDCRRALCMYLLFRIAFVHDMVLVYLEIHLIALKAWLGD